MTDLSDKSRLESSKYIVPLEPITVKSILLGCSNSIRDIVNKAPCPFWVFNKIVCSLLSVFQIISCSSIPLVVVPNQSSIMDNNAVLITFI